MFENSLSPEPTLKSQLISHLPIALIAIGLAATMVALHVAVAGVVALALVHVIVGVGLLAFRRYRTKTPIR